MTDTWYSKMKNDNEVYPLKVEKEDEIIYGPNEAISSWKKGTKIRDRRKGAAVPQEYGVITKVTEDYIEVEWYNSKTDKKRKDNRKEKYNKEDLVSIFSILGKE